MRTLRAWWNKAGWAAWAVLAACASIFSALFYAARRDTKKTPAALPAVPEPLRQQVAAAEEAALVAKVEARVRSEDQRAALQEIGKIDDGRERRRRLANLLKEL